MRKPSALLVPSGRIVAVVAWWTRVEGAVSVVPGWHVPILAPYALAAIFVSAVLLAIAFVILYMQLGGGKSSR
jgi:hypothetical protein